MKTRHPNKTEISNLMRDWYRDWYRNWYASIDSFETDWYHDWYRNCYASIYSFETDLYRDWYHDWYASIDSIETDWYHTISSVWNWAELPVNHRTVDLNCLDSDCIPHPYQAKVHHQPWLCIY